MDDEIIALYCLCDDLLQAQHHQDNPSYTMSDAEVITSAIVSALYFSGNQSLGCRFLKHYGYIPHMLSNSRFNRRLHHLSEIIRQLFQCIGRYWIHQNESQVYAIDSFPIASCDNKRIKRSQRLQGEQWRGYQASKRRYFYGMKVHLMVTESGQPVECFLTEGSESTQTV